MRALLDTFPALRVLVCGDIMLDRYVLGSVDRISPEAPVPVLLAGEERDVPGGAANVALMVRALGAEVALCGVVGDDPAGERLRGLLAASGIGIEAVLTAPGRCTTVKTRVVAHKQQLLRIDREESGALPPALAQELEAAVCCRLEASDALILSDYGKGVIGPAGYAVLQAAAATAGCLVSVDPKVEHFSLYRNADLITPNNREASAGIGMPIRDGASLRAAGAAILEKLAPRALLITRSELGMALFEPGREVLEIPARARDVYDVTGAGDMVIAVATLALAGGASCADAARLANTAAGIEVAHFGCHPVGREELADALAE